MPEDNTRFDSHGDVIYTTSDIGSPIPDDESVAHVGFGMSSARFIRMYDQFSDEVIRKPRKPKHFTTKMGKVGETSYHVYVVRDDLDESDLGYINESWAFGSLQEAEEFEKVLKTKLDEENELRQAEYERSKKDLKIVDARFTTRRAEGGHLTRGGRSDIHRPDDNGVGEDSFNFEVENEVRDQIPF